MCKYTTKYKDSWGNRKDYKCEEKDYTASGYCVFHYGLQGNDSQEINPAKVDEKKDDFETRLRKFLDINKDSVDTNKDTEYNCIGWVFPEIDFDKLKKGIGAIFEFTRPVNFIKTIFSGGADFTEVKFSREVSFRESQFLKKASFTEATFLQKADFRKSMFLEEAYFKYTLFSEDANFFRAKFSQKITLQGTIFLERADFARIHVGYALNFSDTFFFQQLLLAHASCKDNVIFDNCYAQYIDLEYCEVTLVCNIARSLIKNIVIKNAMFKSIMFRSVSPNIEYYKHQKNEQIEKGFEKIPELLEKKNEKLVVQSSKDEIQKTIENLKQEFNIRKSVTEDKDKIKNELKIIDDILQIQKKLKTLQELEELKTLSEEFKEFKEFKILSEEFKTIEEFKTLSKKFKTLSEEFKTIEEFKTLSKKFKTLSDESKTLSDESKTLSDESKTLSDESKTLSDESKTLSEKFKILSDESKTLSEKFKILSDEFKTLSEKSKTLSDEFKTLSDESKTLSDESKTLSDESKTLSDESKTLSDESKTLSEKFKTIKELTKRISASARRKFETENKDAIQKVLKVAGNKIDVIIKGFEKIVSKLRQQGPTTENKDSIDTVLEDLEVPAGLKRAYAYLKKKIREQNPEEPTTENKDSIDTVLELKEIYYILQVLNTIKTKIEDAKKTTEKDEWDFRGEDLSSFSFVECNFSVARFEGAYIQETHFDNCTFPKKNKRWLLYHQNIREVDDEKLQSAYQHFKRNFIENRSYQLAQDFHFQEMELRKKQPTGSIEKGILWIYKYISEYGTNHIRPFCWLVVWLIGWLSIFPIFLFRKTWCIHQSIDWGLYRSGVAFLLKLTAPIILVIERDITFTSIYNTYFDAVLPIFSVIIYDIVIVILITFFTQALSRNFKR